MSDAPRAVHWSEFRERAPDIVRDAQALLSPDGEEPRGFLATVSAAGQPRLSPVCRIFCGDDIYISTAMHTLESKDLAQDGSYVLHAFLGEGDEEFQLSGHAELITDEAHRARVQDEFSFPAFDRDVPVFELLISRALRATWIADRDPQGV